LAKVGGAASGFPTKLDAKRDARRPVRSPRRDNSYRLVAPALLPAPIALRRGRRDTSTEAQMDRLIDGEEWTIRAFTRDHLRLDEDLGRDAAPVPLLEEIRMVAALVALLCVAILLA
jgi:hypothetical protein